MLGVNRSAVRSWENGDFKPSAESLIGLANKVDYELALELWGKAGINIEKLTTARGSQRLRLTFGLFPFAAGDIVGIDDSATDDIWGLLGTLVVVEFSRYPGRTEVDLSQRWREGGTKVDLAELEKQESIARQYEKRDGGLTPAERTQREDAQRASVSDLVKRLTPDPHGLIGLRHIQAGWLRLRLAGDPDFTTSSGDLASWVSTDDPWQLVLEGASVKGIVLGERVPLFPVTGWERSKKGRNITLREVRVLGRVSCWERAESSVLPDLEPAATKLRAQGARNKTSDGQETQ